jgi:hypothetical protein
LAMQGKKRENVIKMLGSLEELAESPQLSATARRHIEELIEFVKKELAKASPKI